MQPSVIFLLYSMHYSLHVAINVCMYKLQYFTHILYLLIYLYILLIFSWLLFDAKHFLIQKLQFHETGS